MKILKFLRSTTINCAILLHYLYPFYLFIFLKFFPYLNKTKNPFRARPTLRKRSDYANLRILFRPDGNFLSLVISDLIIQPFLLKLKSATPFELHTPLLEDLRNIYHNGSMNSKYKRSFGTFK